MPRRTADRNRDFWGQALIALSQVTFGVAWALLFAPIDTGKIFLIVLNLVLTVLFLTVGWRFFRKV